MDILKRSLAPITEEAWEEIDEQAKLVLHTNLSARKFVDVHGPKGWGFTSVPSGRLNLKSSNKKGEVCYGVHMVQPLVEARISFDLDVWELDNAVRGAKDINLDALVEATKKLTEFEEKAIYDGYKDGGIKGLRENTNYDPISIGSNKKEILEAVSQGITTLFKGAIEGPYAMVVSPEIWRQIANQAEGYPVRKHIEKLLDGPVIYSPVIDDAFIVSLRGGDLELILGVDYSIGYESHTSEKVTLFITESFTFRVLDPDVFVRLVPKK